MSVQTCNQTVCTLVRADHGLADQVLPIVGHPVSQDLSCLLFHMILGVPFPQRHANSYPPCLLTDAPCSNMLGMQSGLITDSQISASSTREYLWSPSVARLVSSRSGWFPRIPQATPGEEWLQVDLGAPKTVKGVIIQGARGGDSITAVEGRAFVRKFKVAYSLNGQDWESILDPRTQQPKVSGS